MMDYEQAIKFIHDRLLFGSKLGLSATEELLRRLGSPHKKLKFIHIAGTNGKGSTSAFIANILIANGHKTGMYISPFVHNFNERIQIDNVQIPNEDLAIHTEKVASVIDDTLQPTEFEVVTAVGLLHFLAEGCDYVVLEVGLGGRFDSTNVIPPPLVSVITSISIDHTEFLGETIEQIAFEKCGIIKSDSSVAVYPDNPQGAIDVIKSTVSEKKVPIIFGNKDAISIISQDINGTRFTYKGTEYEISLLGLHQVYNAVTAITAIENLNISEMAIKNGLKNTKFSGRFEVISTPPYNPLIIIDGAHNYSGVLALKNALETYFKNKKITLVMGMLKDKEYEKCVAELAPLADIFIATQPENHRAISSIELETIAKKYVKTTKAFDEKIDAVNYAISHTDKNDVICICGSLYLIGGIQI